LQARRHSSPAVHAHRRKQPSSSSRKPAPTSFSTITEPKDAALQIEQEAHKHGTRVEAFRPMSAAIPRTRKLVDQCIARLGRLDIVVANAGCGTSRIFPSKNDGEAVDDMMRVNLKSVYSIIHFAVPHMISRSRARSFPSARRPASAANHSIPITALPKAASSALSRSFDGARASQHPRELRCSRLGRHRHVQSRSGNQGRQEMAASVIRSDARHCGRNRRTHFVPRPDLANFMTGEIIK